MGLRLDIQSSVSEAFNGDLSDAVKSFSLEQSDRAAGDYDTTTGLFTPGITTSYPSRGVFATYDLEERFNTPIEVTDVKLIILVNELDTDPRLKDIVIEGSNRYRVINKSYDPANATVTLHIRNASS